jgi:hypothetical protein
MKRSSAVKLGITAALAATLLACGLGDDDDCDDDDDSLRQIRIVHTSSVRKDIPVHVSGALPASGGFGTHLADCGG